MEISCPLLIFLLLLFTACEGERENASYEPRSGDILFQSGDCGDFCEAIKAVTPDYEGMQLTHNGMVKAEGDSIFVIEATGTGVRKTPLSEFLYRHTDENGRPKVVAGRLKEEYLFLVKDALREAEKHLDKAYDPVFDLENDRYYCSELIHLSLKTANDGTPLFSTPPMTFKDSATGKFIPEWTAYFDSLEAEIPEGEAGLNPGSMANEDDVLEMVYDFRRTEQQGY